MRTALIYSFLFLVLVNCSLKRTVDKQGLLSYLKDEKNGLTKSQLSEGIQYQLTLRPVELVMEQMVKSRPGYDKDSLKTAYANRLYFILAISQDSVEIFGRLRQNYATLLRKMTFELEKYIQARNETGELFYLKDFIYPRMYNQTEKSSVLLCFEDKGLKNSGDFILQVRDFVNESDELLEFKFFKKDLQQIPDLKL